MKFIVMALLAAAAALFLKQYLDNVKWEKLVEEKKKGFGQEGSLKNKTSVKYAKTCTTFAVLLVLVTLVPVSLFEGPAFMARVDEHAKMASDREMDSLTQGYENAPEMTAAPEYALGEEVSLEEYEEIEDVVINDTVYRLLEKDESYFALSEDGTIYTIVVK